MLIDWNFLNNIGDVNIMIEEFYFKLYDLIDKHVPKKKPPSRKYPPWFNGHLIIKQKNKYKAYNAYKKCKNEENYKVLKKLRAEV